MAFSYTFDIGCEYGGGVSCARGKNRESFLGMMLDAPPRLPARRIFHYDGTRPTPDCTNASALTKGVEVQWNGKPG